MPRLVLAVILLSLPTRLPLRPETPPPRFTLGPADLVLLAISMPPDGGLPAEMAELPPPRTLRELHARAEVFLGEDVRRALEKARWRLEAARRSAATDPGTGSYEGTPWGALLAVVVGSISYSTNGNLRDTKACVTFLEGLERRARALRDDVSETDEPATPDLLARWERLRSELRQNLSCRQRR